MDVTRNDVVVIESRENGRERERDASRNVAICNVSERRTESRTNNRFSLYRDARALGIESFVVASSHIVFHISIFSFFDFSVVLLL